jgi:hypothetical protein
MFRSFVDKQTKKHIYEIPPRSYGSFFQYASCYPAYSGGTTTELMNEH